MKKHPALPLLISFCLLLTASRCKEPVPPEILPCFTIVADAYRDPRAPVQFQNCSEGAESYLWEFGDGTTSTEVNPTHTYAAVGEYYVNLTAINGDYDERTQQTLRLGYPSITKVRVLRVPVMNRHGVPFDPDGSGLELQMVFYRAGQNGAVRITQTTSNATLPVDLNVTQPLSIAPPSLRLLLLSGNSDTIAINFFSLADFIDSPIEHFENDSLEYEILMEAYQ